MKMIKEYLAANATVEIEDDGLAAIAFATEGPDQLFVSMRREVLERLQTRIAEALSVAPAPSRPPSKAPEPDRR